MFKTYIATLSGNKIELPEELFARHPKITELVLFMDNVKINIPVDTIHEVSLIEKLIFLTRLIFILV